MAAITAHANDPISYVRYSLSDCDFDPDYKIEN